MHLLQCVTLGFVSTALTSTPLSAKAEEPVNLSFSDAQTFTLPQQKELEAITFADFDGDGKLDAISGNYGGNLIVRLNKGDANLELSDPFMVKHDGTDIKLTHW